MALAQNYLTPTSFSIVIDRLPSVEFFTQKVNIPSLAAGSVEQITPLNNIYQPKQKIAFADLDVTFIVDEQMVNYQEIFAWIKLNAQPTELGTYNNETDVSDISVIINNSHKNSNIRFNFIDCFPTDLSPISLDITNQDVIYPEVTATFRYTYFTIDNLND